MSEHGALRGATWNDNKRRRTRPALVLALAGGVLAGSVGLAPVAFAGTLSGSLTDSTLTKTTLTQPTLTETTLAETTLTSPVEDLSPATEQLVIVTEDGLT